MATRTPKARAARATGVVAGGAITAALIASAGLTQAATGANAQQRHQRLPRVQPAAGTRHFPASTRTTEQIRQLVRCGNTMFAVVEQSGRTFSRHNALSFAAAAPFTMTSWTLTPMAWSTASPSIQATAPTPTSAVASRRSAARAPATSPRSPPPGAGSLVTSFRHSAVASDVGAAYFGGHERWSQNADACNWQGPGAIAAPGMQALDPGTGHLILNSTGTARLTSGIAGSVRTTC